MSDTPQDVIVIGAGLVGAMVAVMLQRSGKFKVTIYERYNDIRNIPSLGRSINLVMTKRGLKAAELLGIADDLKNLSVKIIGRSMWQSDGSNVFQKYGRESDCNYSVSRYELNCFLIHEAERLGVLIHFGHILKSMEWKGDEGSFIVSGNYGKMIFDVVDGEQGKQVDLTTFTPIIGADGGGSATRKVLKEKGITSYTEDILGQSYREMIFPGKKNVKGEPTGEYVMEKSALHIWPRRTHMLMGLADRQGGSFTGTLYVDNNEWPKTLEDGIKFLETHYNSACPLLGGAEAAATQILEKPPGLLGTVRTDKYNYSHRVLLIGDAAHAIVPFFGQGCNCGFEDCVVLNDLVEKFFTTDGKSVQDKDTWSLIFSDFHNQRKPSCDAIADLALENFIEMRELVGDKEFLKSKHVEKILESAFPEKFRSRYSMVCYGSALEGNITYANALKLGGVIKMISGQVVKEVEDKVGTEYAYHGGKESGEVSNETEDLKNKQNEQEDLVKSLGEPKIAKHITPMVMQLAMDLGTV